MSDKRLTTKEILEAAYHITNEYADCLQYPRLDLEITEDETYLKFVHNILLEAANPNGAMIVAKFHDEQAANHIKAGNFGVDDLLLLPFTQLPKELQSIKIFFRTVVVSFAVYWAHH